MSFNGIGKTKGIASKNAAMKCLHWLEMNEKLKNGKPIIYNKENLRDIQKPIKLNVTPGILNNMINLVETYDKEIRNLTAWEDVFNTPCFNTIYQTVPDHPIVGKTTYTDKEARNTTLRQRLFERSTNEVNLPIFEFKNEILSKLENNRVLLIEGDTGCGKTTQVPQFIMDSFAQNGNATDCNILVSQPRRISAISLADRIAHERDEEVGDVVGFQVRLEHALPRELGGILFCTTGILLKKLQSNPNLVGCSHVILDEAHERQIDTDMLMILLKRALKQNSDLKVLIMSATINAHLIQQYFDCPAVKIPGRLYPVKMNFLEDIERLPNIQKYRYIRYRYNDNENERITVNFEKIVQIIRWISQHKPPGAILCFLPGWNEIATVQTMLEESTLDSENLILPIHSKISHNEQRKIFQHAPANMRKIILATDIAETGITVTDVVYVVDSAIRKESRWDDIKNLSYIANRWVSQANIHQRKGRAGRVKPGESYHLITMAEYKKLESHPMPQVLCNPLEKVILDSKTYTNEKAIDFLGKLLQPPNPVTIQKAVEYLIDLEVLDNEENLTTLGKRMMLIPAHPKFSKALVYSSIFDCIHPVVTIASVFSGEENLFYGVLDHKLDIRENKKLYHPFSDHIAIAWIYKQWFIYNTTNPNLISKFGKKMKLRLNRMQILNQIRGTFIQQLIQSHLLTNVDVAHCENFDIATNKYENNDELVRALIYSATQQLIEHKDIGFKNGILRTGVNELRTQNHAKVVISGESVNYKRKSWPSPYLTYFNSTHCEMRRGTVIRETSMISPLTVLLFSQGNTQCHKHDDDRTEIIININKKHCLRFSCDNNTADVLLKFKDIMWSLVQYSLKKQGFIAHDDFDSKKIFDYKNKLLETLSETLLTSSKLIENVEDSKISIS
nr:PREDICTED: putative ATP-dependent RNA helicase DHX30 [Linepithema humile]XP_012232349.1 PREDICTED: putative ATP-dependent RNA helicase DHX30 [Linepithema humile]